MKIKFARQLLGVTLSALLTIGCQAAYHTEFETPPFNLDSTIIGTGGWISSAGASSALAHAKVVKAPWGVGDDSNALRLWRETSDTNSIRLKNNLDEPLEGQVKVTIGMAFDFSGNSGRTNFAFFDLSQNHSPLLLGFINSSSGGIFYRGIKDNPDVVILAKEDVKPNSVYTFTLSIDINAQTFDLLVSGLKADGSDFLFAEEGISAGPFNNKKLSTFYLESTGSSVLKSYVTSIDAHAIPEAESFALLLAGGIVTGLFLQFRPKHP